MYVNKRVLSFCGAIGMTVGGALPMLFGDNSMLDGWGLLGGLVGGLFGIWLGVWLGKRIG